MVHKVLLIIVLFLLAFGITYGYYFYRWRHLWTIAGPIDDYNVAHVHDDTLRVVMIGDSWAGFHSELHMDNYLCSELEKRIQTPVSVVSKGKGGEKIKGIYRLLFQMGGYGTKPLFFAGADYCIISAGINDAAANLGTKQFCAHYRLILNFLIGNGIRPVVIEVPDVDIWGLYGGKSKKDLLADYVKSTMTRCGMYNYHEYREELYAMLQKEHLMERVVYIPMLGWNGNGIRQNLDLFMPDRIHLNREGYKRLDACIAEAIARDLQQSQDSTFVNKPVSHDAKQ